MEDVVGRHLVRFGTRDELVVEWVREGGAFGTVPSYVCAYTKALYRLLCAESTAPEILKKGETVPHAQAL